MPTKKGYKSKGEKCMFTWSNCDRKSCLDKRTVKSARVTWSRGCENKQI